MVSPPHSSGTRFRLASSRLTRSGSESGLVDLVHGDDDRHRRSPGMIDGLDGLRHDAVVGGHDQDHDVGRLSPARAHGGEGLVARRVEEGDTAVRGRVHLIGSDVLRDSAELALGDLGGSDGVEQRRLAVVDVAHDGHHGRPRTALGRIRLFLLEDLPFERPDLDVEMEPVRDEPGRRRVEHLVDRGHDAELEQRLDDLDRLPPHGGCQLAHRHRLGELDELALDLLRRLGHAGRRHRSGPGPRRGLGRHRRGRRRGSDHGRRRGCRAGNRRRRWGGGARRSDRRRRRQGRDSPRRDGHCPHVRRRRGSGRRRPHRHDRSRGWRRCWSGRSAQAWAAARPAQAGRAGPPARSAQGRRGRSREPGERRLRRDGRWWPPA